MIYSKSWDEHLQHLDTVLDNLEQQKIYAKQSKCDFTMTEILYLGHVISQEGVQVDKEKIAAVQKRPTPMNLTKLRGFIGLCSYYRRFIMGFSSLAAPLIELTKKGAFSWSNDALVAFLKLKEIMTTTRLLAIPDFSIPFTIACDASGLRVGAILMQKGHPIAYKSRKFTKEERTFSIYDKEMLAIMHALTKFK